MLALLIRLHAISAITSIALTLRVIAVRNRVRFRVSQRSRPAFCRGTKAPITNNRSSNGKLDLIPEGFLLCVPVVGRSCLTTPDVRVRSNETVINRSE